MKDAEHYDFLIVGAGLYGATCARILSDKGYRVLVIEKRDHVAGNAYTVSNFGIDVHVHGAHIFHTSNSDVWNFIRRFSVFNSFINSPLADYHGERYHLPFNLNTFRELWDDVETAEDAKKKIEEEIALYGTDDPQNLQEQAISLVGLTVFTKLIKEYTEKQWGRDCNLLPPSIIKRVPVRFEANNNYFDDLYQGIPVDGYTKLVERMLSGVEVRLSTDFLKEKETYQYIADRMIYTGPIDEYFSYQFGMLEYRSLRFKTHAYDIPSYQGNAVINYTSHDVPYTRIIEHKFFNDPGVNKTVISEEYPAKWEEGLERYYPVNDESNIEKYVRYIELAKENKNVFFGGRLGLYQYLDMDDTILAAMEFCKKF